MLYSAVGNTAGFCFTPGRLQETPREDAPEQAAQGKAGVPIPEGIYELCGRGTWGHGLVVTLAVLGEQS